ncbi:BtrH N-terminal domain-containing protein [Thiohalomonas denitrificans]|uniref:BtrH N-terminal domain-containing protein n=1 Tax=Thiohalomonas denitrificans TaxID=415747 RepID=UPI0026F17836|nr:BtrH N-terminal domain-containing protein [Thiohalomonas denitrificans]
MPDTTAAAQRPEFHHSHSAHCESGVMSSLLRHYGLDISEPMAFGLASALAFAYVPIIRVGGFPLFAYRMPPGAIIKGLRKSLGVKMRLHHYRNEQAGMKALDDHLDSGRVVGLQSSVYWLPYFPPDMRFHFNAHNLIVFGRNEAGGYRISDPVFEHTVTCPAADLQKARFVKGVFAPRGLLYYPERMPTTIDYDHAVGKAVKKTAFRMLKAPLSFVGVRGIRTLARRLGGLPSSGTDPRYARLLVAQIIRMQEEIGTGGGGFRFMYASFLQEASDRIGQSHLSEAAAAMTEAGDAWRDFALAGARLCRDRGNSDYAGLAHKLFTCAEREESAYRMML